MIYLADFSPIKPEFGLFFWTTLFFILFWWLALLFSILLLSLILRKLLRIFNNPVDLSQEYDRVVLLQNT